MASRYPLVLNGTAVQELQSADTIPAAALEDSGVTAGTYAKVTTDAKGRVTAGSALASSDVTTALGFTPLSNTSPVQVDAASSAFDTFFTLNTSATGKTAAYRLYDNGFYRASVKMTSGAMTVGTESTGGALNLQTAGTNRVVINTSGVIIMQSGTSLQFPDGTTMSSANGTTQAEKTANTTMATTAFVDRLRSLTTQSTASTGGTAVIGDRGALVSVTGGVTIPASVFAANDTFTIYNNSASNITLTQGSGLTLRQVGTANTGNRTLAQRGLATVVFISATEAVVSGGGLT